MIFCGLRFEAPRHRHRFAAALASEQGSRHGIYPDRMSDEKANEDR